jgi:hypothetical protein
MRLLCASVLVRVVCMVDQLFFRDPNSDPAGTRCQAAARGESAGQDRQLPGGQESWTRCGTLSFTPAFTFSNHDMSLLLVSSFAYVHQLP